MRRVRCSTCRMAKAGRMKADIHPKCSEAPLSAHSTKSWRQQHWTAYLSGKLRRYVRKVAPHCSYTSPTATQPKPRRDIRRWHFDCHRHRLFRVTLVTVQGLEPRTRGLNWFSSSSFNTPVLPELNMPVSNSELLQKCVEADGGLKAVIFRPTTTGARQQWINR